MLTTSGTPNIAMPRPFEWLFTKQEWSQLLLNGCPFTRVDPDPFPVVKLFSPYADHAWLLTEIDPRDENTAFGLCDLGKGYPEIGYVCLNTITNPPSLSALKDLNFRATRRLSEYAEEARKAGATTV